MRERGGAARGARIARDARGAAGAQGAFRPHAHHHSLHSEQLELLEDKLRELASLPPRESDDRAVALSAVDALRRELALVTRAGLVSVVFGKVGERRRE